VCRLNGATTHVERRTTDLVDAQPPQAGTGAHDVDDGVHSADIVQMDLVGRHAMHIRLGFDQALENSVCLLGDTGGEIAALQYFSEVSEAAVRMTLLIDDDVHLLGSQSAPPYSSVLDTEAVEGQARKVLAQIVDVDPTTHQGSQDHVAGNAGKAVEVGGAHGAHYARTTVFALP